MLKNPLRPNSRIGLHDQGMPMGVHSIELCLWTIKNSDPMESKKGLKLEFSFFIIVLRFSNNRIDFESLAKLSPVNSHRVLLGALAIFQPQNAV